MNKEIEKFQIQEFREFLTRLYSDHSGSKNPGLGKSNNSGAAYTIRPEEVRRSSYRGDCLFLMDFKDEIIHFSFGLKDLLGYEEEDVDFELLLSCIHPKDVGLFQNILQVALANSILPDEQSDPDLDFRLTCRLRHKEGHFVHALMQWLAIERNPDGVMTKALIRISDISFLGLRVGVRWFFDSESIPRSRFNEQVRSKLNNPFTSRELEVIRGIESQLTNEQIASNLNISRHTVATHRKSIMRKSTKSNTIELLIFCRQIGVL